MTIEEIFARNIKALREALGYTIGRASTLTFVSWYRWKQWEIRERMPSMKLMPRIAKTLKCTVADLVAD